MSRKSKKNLIDSIAKLLVGIGALLTGIAELIKVLS